MADQDATSKQHHQHYQAEPTATDPVYGMTGDPSVALCASHEG